MEDRGSSIEKRGTWSLIVYECDVELAREVGMNELEWVLSLFVAYGSYLMSTFAK